VGFIVFFKWAFKKKRVFFLVRFFFMNPVPMMCHISCPFFSRQYK